MRRLLAHCACAFLAALVGVASAQSDPPNLIFILTDDLGTEAIDAPYWNGEIFDAAYAGLSSEGYIRPDIVTQNLFTWAAQGVSFTNVRHTPNCSPTRACLMTGRDALRTGVYGVLTRLKRPEGDCDAGLAEYPLSTLPPEIGRLSLQSQETTLAELLQEAGYYTILIDKWHLGQDDEMNNASNDNWQDDKISSCTFCPLAQGFDYFDDWAPYLLDTEPNAGSDDDPNDAYDSRLVSALDHALLGVAKANAAQKPYALFFHTIVPHARCEDNALDKMEWWIIDENLARQTRDVVNSGAHDLENKVVGDGDPTTPERRRRYTMNVEALDTALGQLLSELNVVDAPLLGDYVDISNTVVFFTADNGTDGKISVHGTEGAKNSMYDGGILVPMFVFGEGISDLGTPLPDVDDRLISATDYFNTIADIVGIPLTNRSDPNFPLQSVSFADSIGWGLEGFAYEDRTESHSSFGNVDSVVDECGTGADANEQLWKVAYMRIDPVSGDLYKLICRSGGAGLADNDTSCSTSPSCEPFTCIDDELYNLTDDPGESANLFDWTMTHAQTTLYFDMRDRIVDQWPSAVSTALAPEDLGTYTVSHTEGDYTLTVTYVSGVRQPCDADILEYGTSTLSQVSACTYASPHQAAYESLVAIADDAEAAGTDSPDVRVIDIPATHTRVAANPTATVIMSGLTVGWDNTGGTNYREWRSFVKFADIAPLLPDGFTDVDILDAQIILRFNSDPASGTGTALITVHPASDDWTPSSVSQASAFQMINTQQRFGFWDPAPEIIATVVSGYPAIRVMPLPISTPVSFGHDVDDDASGADTRLVDVVLGWMDESIVNNGIVFRVATKLTGADYGSDDQHLMFQASNATLRLTLRR